MRKFFVLVFVISVLGVCFNAAVHADTIILKDGRKIEGIITEEGNDYYDVKIKIGTMKVTKDMVAEVKKLSAEENFVYMGNEFLVSNDYDDAIGQYKKALKANPDYQPAKDALAKVEKIKSDAEAKKKKEIEEKNRETAEKRDKIKKGFGFMLDSADGQTILIGITPGGSAEAVGLRPRDEIIKINDMAIKDKPLDETNGYLLKGEITDYTFLIQRECNLTRKKIDYQKHSFVGVGIFLDVASNMLVINSVITGEPADLAGLKAKDEVVSIDGKSASGMSVDDAANLISGAESSKLKIVIQRSVEIERK